MKLIFCSNLEKNPCDRYTCGTVRGPSPPYLSQPYSECITMEKTRFARLCFYCCCCYFSIFSDTFPIVFYIEYKLAGIIFTPYPHLNFFYYMIPFSFSKAPPTILWQTDSFCRFFRRRFLKYVCTVHCVSSVVPT